MLTAVGLAVAGITAFVVARIVMQKNRLDRNQEMRKHIRRMPTQSE